MVAPGGVDVIRMRATRRSICASDRSATRRSSSLEVLLQVVGVVAVGLGEVPDLLVAVRDVEDDVAVVGEAIAQQVVLERAEEVAPPLHLDAELEVQVGLGRQIEARIAGALGAGGRRDQEREHARGVDDGAKPEGGHRDVLMLRSPPRAWLPPREWCR